MKIKITAVIISLAIFSFGQTGTGNPPSPSGANGKFMAASDSLRITAPTIDQQIGSSEVTVRYEITNRGADASPSPTYQVQLDGRDPAETLDNSYSFTGLAPGNHSITVQLVDANYNPIGGSQAVVHFKTYTPGANTPGSTGNPGTHGTAPPQITGTLTPPAMIKAALPLPPRSELPDGGGELPLLSLVGFGVLFGGAISALRRRK